MLSTIDNEDLQFQYIIPISPVVNRFVCQREMVRDYARETALNDGFAYWRTTGRLIVTWDNGSVTYIEYSEPKHSSLVIDCGYDGGLPF